MVERGEVELVQVVRILNCDQIFPRERFIRDQVLPESRLYVESFHSLQIQHEIQSHTQRAAQFTHLRSALASMRFCQTGCSQEVTSLAALKIRVVSSGTGLGKVKKRSFVQTSNEKTLPVALTATMCVFSVKTRNVTGQWYLSATNPKFS